MSTDAAIPPKDQTNFSGIPTAQFVEDVDKHMKGEESAEDKLKGLDEAHQKYKLMEQNLVTRRRRLLGQIPDITSSLAMIDKLQANKAKDEEMETQFMLSESVYSKAKVPPTEKVCLWLGANVMLEYSLDDAQTMLKQNRVNALKYLSEIAFDLDFLRDQMTITEVTMARTYNWDVRRKRGQKAVASGRDKK